MVGDGNNECRRLRQRHTTGRHSRVELPPNGDVNMPHSALIPVTVPSGEMVDLHFWAASDSL